MKFLRDLGSKIVSRDASTLESVETIFEFFIYGMLGLIFGLFIQPAWLAAVLAVVFPLLMGFKTNIGKMAAEQKATVRTTKMFTSAMISMFSPKGGSGMPGLGQDPTPPGMEADDE